MDEVFEPKTKSSFPCGAHYTDTGEFGIDCNGRCETTCPFHPVEKARRLEKIRAKYRPMAVKFVETEEPKKRVPKCRQKPPSTNYDVLHTAGLDEMTLYLTEAFSYLADSRDNFTVFYDSIRKYLQGKPKTQEGFNNSVTALMEKTEQRVRSYE